MVPVRFLMIGGFLGAGKTTLLAQLARHYSSTGLRVGLVTNDQAFDLVDTRSLRAQGFTVGEVPGACFCCKFDDLIETMQALCDAQRPDVILAEPVGSCTDLVATVVEPLRALYGEDFDPGRFAVLLKPEHGRKILSQETQLGFSEQAAYIFRKQLEEADLIVLNKIDKLATEEIDELSALIAADFPDRPCLQLSAKTGTGLAQLIEALEQPAEDHVGYMEVDYDIYAAGEAELGWLNATVDWTFPHAQPLEQLACAVVTEIQTLLKSAGREAAHLKVLASDDDSNAAIVNLVGTDAVADRSLTSTAASLRIELTINARVATTPNQLSDIVHQALQTITARYQATSTIRSLQQLSPGRPVPTHRFTA